MYKRGDSPCYTRRWFNAPIRTQPIHGSYEQADARRRKKNNLQQVQRWFRSLSLVGHLKFQWMWHPLSLSSGGPVDAALRWWHPLNGEHVPIQLEDPCTEPPRSLPAMPNSLPIYFNNCSPRVSTIQLCEHGKHTTDLATKTELVTGFSKKPRLWRWARSSLDVNCCQFQQLPVPHCRQRGVIF